MRPLALPLCLVYFQSVATIAQKCYNADTSESTDRSLPCNPSGGSKHCCSPSSACLDNGLCLYGADGSYNSGTCMDRTWNDETCFAFCKEALGPYGGNYVFYRCDNNNYCCNYGGNATNCCSGSTERTRFTMPPDTKIVNATNLVDGYTIVRIEDFVTSSSTQSSSSPTTEPTQGTQTQSSPTPAQSSAGITTTANDKDADADNHKNVVAVGVGVGVGVGVPLLAALVGALMLLRREKGRSANAEAKIQTEGAYSKVGQEKYEGTAQRRPGNLQELDAPELAELSSRREMYGGGNGIDESIK